MFVPSIILMLICVGAAAAIYKLAAARATLQRQVAAMEFMETQLRTRADTDPVTGLKNRTAFSRELEDIVESGRQTEIGVLFLDLDRFKEVNDTFGHKVGDALLKAVATRLLGTITENDTLARIGGDEFAAIIRTGGAKPIEDVAMAMVEAVYESYLIEGHLVHVGTSVGIAVGSASTINASDLLRQADIAMYEAKLSKTNSFEIFDDRMSEMTAVRSSMRAELENAILDDKLQLALQPVVEARTGKLASVEALLRWPDSSRGPISPGDLVPMAEASGQILQLGEWVLERSLKIAADLKTIPIAVNVSPIQFRHHGFAQKVSEMLIASGVTPDLLRLEITEGVLISHMDAAKSTIRQLRQIGVEVVLDDFGTGYSSLSYLQNLEFDCVKIDKSFLRDLGRHAKSIEMMRAVIDLGHSLRLKVVAEGVENEWQARLLQLLNCDYLQGFYFGPPMDLESLIEFSANDGERNRMMTGRTFQSVSDVVTELPRLQSHG